MQKISFALFDLIKPYQEGFIIVHILQMGTFIPISWD